MSDVYVNLKEKGVVLPKAPEKGGVYTPVIPFGPDNKLLYCSGCGCNIGDEKIIGKLGKDLTIEMGQHAAYNCMLNLLANLDAYTGNLNNIKRFIKVLAFVNCTDDFTEQPQVVNGGSNLLKEIFGDEIGVPARTAMGSNAVPGNQAVEIELIAELK